MPWVVLGVLAALVLVFVGMVTWQIRRRFMHYWLPTYLSERSRYQAPTLDQEIHVILCIADHFEPKAGNASVETGRQRVATWVEQYPKQFGHFRDSDGRPPRYTFFFPIEEYEKEYLDALAGLCRAGFGEVEVHLHHDNDTPEGLRKTLLGFKEILVDATRPAVAPSAHRRGDVRFHPRQLGPVQRSARRLVLRRRSRNPDPARNGLLCRPDLSVGADATQPPIINSIYYASDRPGGPRSQDDRAAGRRGDRERAVARCRGRSCSIGADANGAYSRPWKMRVYKARSPRASNGCGTGSERGLQVPGRPDWFFVKLHAHGGPEHDHETLLGAPMVKFHQDLARLARDNAKFHFHYVTAREMVNLIKAAQAGYKGPIAGALDWEIVSNLVSGEGHAPG